MNYRHKTLLARKAYTADGVETIDINAVTPVSRIVVAYEALNGNTSHGIGHPVRCIPKVELIDGSDVLYNLSGAEVHAADWYNNKIEPAARISYLTSHYGEAVLSLNFGRYLWDPVLAFDPTKFINPQLKITVDLDAGVRKSPSGYLTVLGFLFDEKTISPAGFLMHKEIKSYAPGATTHEYTNLPTDHPYRKLFIRAQKYGTDPNLMLSNIKLSSDEDTKVIMDQSIGDVIRGIVSSSRPYRERILVPADTTARNFYCTPCHRPLFASSEWRTTPFSEYESIFEGDGGQFTIKSTAAGPNMQILCEGHMPHSVIELPFGIQDEVDDWFDVSKVGSLKLDITSGASALATDSIELFLQQLRKY